MAADYALNLPACFADYAWEVASKGYFSDARLIVDGTTYLLTFYDAARLAQEIESALERGSMFFEPNLVVVPAVTALEMQRAVDQLMHSYQAALLIPQ